MKGDILHFYMSDQFQERLIKPSFQSGKQTKGKLTFHDRKGGKKGKMSSRYHINTERGHDINCSISQTCLRLKELAVGCLVRNYKVSL